MPHPGEKDVLLSTWFTYNIISSATISPDGTSVASGTSGGAVSVWDIQRRHVIAGPLKGHTAIVNSVAFSPDGNYVVSASDDCTIRLWDVQTGSLVAGPLRGHLRAVSSVAYSFDGTRIASGSADQTICIWDINTRTVLSRSSKWHSAVISSLAFSPNGAHLVSGTQNGRICLWDIRDQIVAGPRAYHSGRVLSVAFSPSGNLIAFGSSDHKVHILYVQRESLDTVARLEGHTDWVLSVTFSFDGAHIISGSVDRTVRVWGVRSKTCIAGPFRAHTSWVSSVAAGAGGTRFISGSHDHTIRVWDMQPNLYGKYPTEFHIDKRPSQGVSTSKKSVLAKYTLLDAEDWFSNTLVTDTRVNSVSFSPDGTRVVSGSDDHSLYIWKLKPGAAPEKLAGHKKWVISVAFSSDGSLIASGSADKTIYIWSAQNALALAGPLEGHKAFVYSLAFSPDGTKLISASGDCTIRVWDVQTGCQLSEPLRGHSDWVRSVSFSPDGTRIVSSSIDRTLRIWDANTYKPICEPLKRHIDWVRSVAFSPDSARIASGSDDKTICVWDAHNGDLLLGPLKGHTSRVNSVAFSPNGRFIASGSQDCTIRIWHAQSGIGVVGPVKGHTGSVLSVTFSPDSFQLASGSSDNTIRLWNIARRDMVEKPFNSLPGQIVSSEMTVLGMSRRLLEHGCIDLSSRICIHQENSAVAGGRFGDIWQGKLDGRDDVAIKSLRLSIQETGGQDHERAMRETHIWSKMEHDNVQQLLGIIMFKGSLGMVSPWMENGNLEQYIQRSPHVDRYKLCRDVTAGVEYLHGMKMVHGDIKAANVLVSQNGVAKLSDFDHSILSDYTIAFSATDNTGGGTLRWMAPELNPMPREEGSFTSTRSMKTDIYALGMTMLEIITGRMPYFELKDNRAVVKAMDNHKKPDRPEELLGPNQRENRMWDLLIKCWERYPMNRPEAVMVFKELQRLSIDRHRRNTT